MVMDGIAALRYCAVSHVVEMKKMRANHENTGKLCAADVIFKIVVGKFNRSNWIPTTKTINTSKKCLDEKVMTVVVKSIYLLLQRDLTKWAFHSYTEISFFAFFFFLPLHKLKHCSFKAIQFPLLPCGGEYMIWERACFELYSGLLGWSCSVWFAVWV